MISDSQIFNSNYNAELFLFNPWRLKICFQFEIIINVLGLHLNPHIIGLRPLEIFVILSVRGPSLDVRI